MNLMQLIESKGWSFEYDTEGNQAALITKCGTRIPADTCQFSSPLVRSWTSDTFEAIADFVDSEPDCQDIEDIEDVMEALWNQWFQYQTQYCSITVDSWLRFIAQSSELEPIITKLKTNFPETYDMALVEAAAIILKADRQSDYEDLRDCYCCNNVRDFVWFAVNQEMR